jgi:hypothetical protein
LSRDATAGSCAQQRRDKLVQEGFCNNQGAAHTTGRRRARNRAVLGFVGTLI